MIRIRCLVNGSSKTRLFGFSYVFGVMQDSQLISGYHKPTITHNEIMPKGQGTGTIGRSSGGTSSLKITLLFLVFQRDIVFSGFADDSGLAHPQLLRRFAGGS
jgi:hypothetical protein